MCKVSDWFPITPLCSLWPKASVGNVIVKGEDLCEVTLCKMLNFIYFNMDLNLCPGQVNMLNYVASTASPGTVLVFLPVILHSFYLLACSLQGFSET